MHRGLFVAHIDDLDALVDTTVIEGHDMPTRQCKDHFDPGFLEGLGRELSTVKGHGGSPSYLVSCWFRIALPGAARPEFLRYHRVPDTAKQVRQFAVEIRKSR